MRRADTCNFRFAHAEIREGGLGHIECSEFRQHFARARAGEIEGGEVAREIDETDRHRPPGRKAPEFANMVAELPVVVVK